MERTGGTEAIEAGDIELPTSPASQEGPAQNQSVLSGEENTIDHQQDIHTEIHPHPSEANNKETEMNHDSGRKLGINDTEHIQTATFDESDFVGTGKCSYIYIPDIYMFDYRLFYHLIELYVNMLRCSRQFLALQEKNFLVMWRRPWYLVVALVLPAIAVLIFFLGNIHKTGSDTNDALAGIRNQIPSPLQGLGVCDAYYSERCLQVAYSPSDTRTNRIMQEVAQYNQVDYNKAMKGFASSEVLKVRLFAIFRFY